MKTLKKVTGIFLTLVMVLGMISSVWAANQNAHTITITNKKSGHKYEAYQIFSGDLAEDKKTLTNIEWGTGVDGDALLEELKSINGGPYGQCKSAEDVAGVLNSFQNDSRELDLFAGAAGKTLKNKAGVSSQNGEKYTIPVVGDGFYLIKDQDNSIPANQKDESYAYTKFILQVVEDVEVKAKSDAPVIEKKIVEGTNRVDANEASVGDLVTYELKTSVPEMDGYEKYYFLIDDTLSDGLTLQAESEDDFQITIGGAEYKNFSLKKEGQSFRIVFKNFIEQKKNSGKEILITYQAMVNEKAVIGVKGNPNEVTLTYSNNPNVDYKGENEPADGDVTGTTPKDTTITYVSGLEIVKVDENGKRLPGAEFEITGEKLNKVKVVQNVFEKNEEGTYYLLKDGSYTETVPSAENENKYQDMETLYSLVEKAVWKETKEAVEAKAEVGEDGALRFEGLGAGTYVIHEVKAPDGYNRLKKDIVLKISCEVPETVLTKDDTAVWKYQLSGELEEAEKVTQDGLVHFTVENKKGIVLPATGGTGTIMIIGAGILLILFGLGMLGVYVSVNRKKNA